MSSLPPDRIDRLENRQTDGLGRLAALEKLLEKSKARLTEKIKANAEERRAGRIAVIVAVAGAVAAPYIASIFGRG